MSGTQSKTQEGIATLDVTVQLSAKLVAEFVSDEQVAQAVERNRKAIEAAIEKATTREVRRFGDAGWLDDNTALWLVEIEGVVLELEVVQPEVLTGREREVGHRLPMGAHEAEGTVR